MNNLYSLSYSICFYYYDVNSKICFGFLQSTLVPDSMTKKGKKKAKIIDYDLDIEITEVVPTLRIEIIYQETKAVTGAEPEFKWGHIHHWLIEKKVLEARLEDLALYNNVLRSRITKVTTRP